MPDKPKKRTHKATYQRRTELAKERGYKNYAQQRKAQELANESQLWQDAQLPEKLSMRRKSTEEMLKLYYDAFYLTTKNYKKGSPKAKWFVEVAKKMSYDEWSGRYPKGVRDYGKKG